VVKKYRLFIKIMLIYEHVFVIIAPMKHIKELTEDLKQYLYSLLLKLSADERKEINLIVVEYKDRLSGFGLQVNIIGNLISSHTIASNRMFFGSTAKRNYEMGCIVKQVINYATQNNKGVVFENLKFKKEFENQGRKFNRIKSNFVWKKLLTLLERKCVENGIQYKKVNPAFTSVIGKFKYQKMYNLSIHESASYVIGRRGLGSGEKLSLYKYPSEIVKEIVFDHVGDKTKRIHSWALWRKLRDNYKTVLTGLQSRLFNLKELNDNLCYEGENPSGKVVPLKLVEEHLSVN
jgi:IS605 OrfB family transposase